jgi:hypothetical protein
VSHDAQYLLIGVARAPSPANASEIEARGGNEYLFPG